MGTHSSFEGRLRQLDDKNRSSIGERAGARKTRPKCQCRGHAIREVVGQSHLFQNKVGVVSPWCHYTRVYLEGMMPMRHTGDERFGLFYGHIKYNPLLDDARQLDAVHCTKMLS